VEILRDPMDINFLHNSIELSVTVCLFFISYINFSCAKHGRYSTILGYGALLAGLANAIHCATVAAYPFLEKLNVAAIGSSSQIVLLIMFGLILKCSRFRHCSTPIILGWLALPIIAAVSIDLYQMMFGKEIQLMAPITWAHIHHPTYLIVAAMWFFTGWAMSNIRNYIFPPFTMVIFFGYAVIANTAIAFIPPEHWEIGNLLAHALKLAGYYTLILMYLISNYRFNAHPIINTPNNHPVGN